MLNSLGVLLVVQSNGGFILKYFDAGELPVSSASHAAAGLFGLYDYVRARQLEGTFPGDPTTGVWPVTVNRVLRGWGQVRRGEYPWLRADWPPPDPSVHDGLAKECRIALYTRVWDAHDCVHAFARGATVGACFRATEKWRDPDEGRLDFDQSGDTVLGGHCVALSPPTFYSPCPLAWSENSCFVFPNSWGKEWGNHGWGAMTHEFFEREMYSAWSTEQKVEFPPLYGSGEQHVQWEAACFLDRRFLAYDIVDVDKDDRLAWAIIVHRRGELHVEDLYVKPHVRRRGFGTKMLTHLIRLAEQIGQPLRFWIPFADVENEEHFAMVRRWFESHGLGLTPAPRAWAAYCATQCRASKELPPVQPPPKPAFTFAGSSAAASVDWDQIRQKHGVSQEFTNIAEDVFRRHDAILRRLA
jgi:GNAT superfamily N-acetyltransferase